MTGPRRQAGFVLVNALFLVAAMSAAALFLLARAEDGRVRLAATQSGEALRANLDAMEALGKTILITDGRRGPIDSPQDNWAKPIPHLDLDRGRVSGEIRDEQSLFNLNSLSNPGDDRAAEAFDEILARVGIAPQIGEAIAEFVSAAGPKNRQAYSQLDPSQFPLSGPVLMLEQILDMPELSDGDFDRLRPHVTALPAGTQLNVNTASELILRAMLPELTSAQIRSVIRRRAETPYESVETFFTELGVPTDIEENPEAIDQGKFSVQSGWFSAAFSAELEPNSARRDVLFRRDTGGQVATEWRVTQFGED